MVGDSLANTYAHLQRAGLVDHIPGHTPDDLDLRFNPGLPIDTGATAVHGLVDRDVAGQRPFVFYAEALAEALADRDLVCATPWSYAGPLFEAEFRRAAVPFHLAGRALVDLRGLLARLGHDDLPGAARHELGTPFDRADGVLHEARVASRLLDALVGGQPNLPDDVTGLDRLVRQDDASDCFRLVEDRYFFAFGKHKGEPIDEVSAYARDYLLWMIRADFPEATKAIVRAELAYGLGPVYEG